MPFSLSTRHYFNEYLEKEEFNHYVYKDTVLNYLALDVKSFIQIAALTNKF